MKKKDTSEALELDKIEKLIDLFESKELSELEVESVGLKIKLKKQYTSIPTIAAAAHSDLKEIAEPVVDSNCHTIKSPMVGTFYRSGSPTTEQFVKEGDLVSSGQVLCIIEAMKIMNEIESDIKGRVKTILVENSHPVEYGEPLIVIDPL